MPLRRRAAHKICVSALELAKALISKEALNGFQRGVGFLIRWQDGMIVTMSGSSYIPVVALLQGEGSC